MKIRFFFFVFFGTLTSCQDLDKQNPNPPDRAVGSKMESSEPDGSWELFKVNDSLFTIEKVYPINYGGQPKITIDSENNRIGGFTGCNAWGTTLNIQNKSLVLIDPIEMHQQGCGGTWEAEFLNFMRNNKSFTLPGDNLVLTSKDNKTMTFKRVE